MIVAPTEVVVGRSAVLAPPFVSWILTGRCNMRCIHCYPSSGSSSEGVELDFEQQVEAARRLAASGVEGVFLSGGEALLVPRLFDLIKLIREYGMRAWICTNGSLVDQQVAQRIADAGISGVSVSLDGSEAELHDRFRCHPGAHRQAIRAIQLLRDMGVSVEVDCTATSYNRSDLGALYSLVNSLGVKSLGLKRFRPLGRGRENSRRLSLPLNDYGNIISGLTVARAAETAAIHVDDPAIYACHRDHGSFSGITTSGWHSTFGCLAGMAWIGLQANGDFTPCPLLNIPFGNVLRDNLPLAMERSRLVKRLRDRNDRQGACGTCDSRWSCGGCRAHAYGVSGDCFAEDPYCVHRYLQSHKPLMGGPRSDAANST